MLNPRSITHVISASDKSERFSKEYLTADFMYLMSLTCQGRIRNRIRKYW
jgi:hypothetical protein